MATSSTGPEGIARQARERLVAEAAREVDERDQAARIAATAHAAAWTAAVGAG